MKCNVCNHEFTPNKENRYVASQQTAQLHRMIWSGACMLPAKKHT